MKSWMTRLAFGVTIFITFGCAFSPPDVDTARDDAGERTDWFHQDFLSRRAITVDNAGRPALTGFPVAVHFDGSDAARFGPSGEQLRFSGVDDTVDLPFEVERMGPSALVWVRLDIAADSTTEFFLYHDNPDATPASDGRATFDGFEAVYHFADSFSAGQPSLDPVSSSLMGPDLVNVIALDSESSEDVVSDGVLGPSLSLQRARSEYLETSGRELALIAEDNEITTYQGWIKTPDESAERIILDNYDAACRGIAIFVGGAGVNDGKLVSDFCVGSAEIRVVSDVVIDDDRWHHFAVVIDRAAGTLQLHIDGSLDSSVSSPSISNPATSNGPTRIGVGTFIIQPYDGLLDEIRVSGALPSHWFGAAFANRADQPMVSIGAEEIY